MPEKRVESAEPTVDPFLEPWSLSDCEELGVDMEQARACHELLLSGLAGTAIYASLHRMQYENSASNNQQTHMHLADTLIRLAHVYEIDDATIQRIAQTIYET